MSICRKVNVISSGERVLTISKNNTKKQIHVKLLFLPSYHLATLSKIFLEHFFLQKVEQSFCQYRKIPRLSVILFVVTVVKLQMPTQESKFQQTSDKRGKELLNNYKLSDKWVKNYWITTNCLTDGERITELLQTVWLLLESWLNSNKQYDWFKKDN